MTSGQKNWGSQPRVIYQCHFFFFFFLLKQKVIGAENKCCSRFMLHKQGCPFICLSHIFTEAFLELSQVTIPLLVGVQHCAHFTLHFFFLPHSGSASWDTWQQQYLQIYNIVYQLNNKKLALRLDQVKNPRFGYVFLTSSSPLPTYSIKRRLRQWMNWNDCAVLYTLTQHMLLSLLNSLSRSGTRDSRAAPSKPLLCSYWSRSHGIPDISGIC